MSTVQLANPIYHDPTPGRTRTRRSSGRRSVAASLSRASSNIDSPRSPFPKDEDAFRYDPALLHTWYVPEELWNRLPAGLRSSLSTVQHAGAVVLTGFARLDEHTQDQDELVHLDHLPPPKFRTVSDASSVFSSNSFSSVMTASSSSQSECTSPITTSLPRPQTRASFSPVSLGSPAQSVEHKNRSRDRSFSTPLESHDAYYAFELSHLRTEALPRLRHLGRKVDYEWVDAKRSADLSPTDVTAFEEWWAEKNRTIVDLCNKGKRLADALGLMSTGMGWCAP